MAEVTIKLEGVEELEKVLLQLPVSMRKKHLRRAIRQGIALIRNEIKATAPVRPASVKVAGGARPGRLRRLVRIRPRKPKRGYLKISLFYPVTDSSVTGVAGRLNPKDAFFWRFVEFGTRFQRAQPYIQRATDGNFRRVVQRVISETNRGAREDLAKIRRKAA